MKKFISILLALAMVLGMSSMAFAADTITTVGGDATSEVKLTAEAATFSVTVPTVLAIAVAANGTVTCATEAKIINNSTSQVKVTAITVTDTAPYTRAAFTTVDAFKAYAANSHIYALKLGTTATLAEDAMTALSSAGGIIGTAINGAAGELPFFYDALSSGFTTAVGTATKIADVVFTVGWY